MVGVGVGSAPELWMLGHGNERATPRVCRPEQPRKNVLVFDDVLEYVERADDVKLLDGVECEGVLLD
jgi:hypothetical protein